MWKVRVAALGCAAVSIGLLATPASAAQTVTKFRGKDANLVVSNCTLGSPAGTTCTAWNVFASQSRLLSDGTVTKSPFLGLDKYRVRFTNSGFTFRLVKSYQSTTVSLNVADNLSTASGSGVIKRSGDDIDVSFSLVANAPADTTHSRVVQKFDDCKIIDRQSFASRTADGSATIDDITYPTVLPDSGFVSTIDVSGQTTITRGDCPPPPTP
jgi:hypothetical protein